MMIKTILFSVLLVTQMKSFASVKKKARNHTEYALVGNEKKDQLLIQNQSHNFKSTLNDIEVNGRLHKTNKENTYHVFDYKNLIITYTRFDTNTNQWKKTIIKMKSFYKENLYDYVIVCDDDIIKEVWFSPEANHLGYDLHNGNRWTFYELERRF